MAHEPVFLGKPLYQGEIMHPDELLAELAVFFPSLSHDGYAAPAPYRPPAARRTLAKPARTGPSKAMKARRRRQKIKRASYWKRRREFRKERRRERRRAAANDANKDDNTDVNSEHTQKQQKKKRRRARAMCSVRMQLTLERNQAAGRWRRAWQARQPHGAVLQRTAPLRPPVYPISRNWYEPDPLRRDKSLLPRPPLPPPLAPCLQCVLAGACCSLTTTPYARAYANDRVHGAQRPGAGSVATTAALWKTKHARLVRAVDRALAKQRAAFYSASMSAFAMAPNWRALKAALSQRCRALEQRALRQAVARGECDAPFLPRPPVQCVRCVREGDAACLQQSADLTALAATAGGSRVDVAWFASSGPPPVSLLPQHCRPLPEAMALVPWDGDGSRDRQRRCRPRARPPPPLRLEAVFCRDPSVLSAPAIATRAQRLLRRIAQKPQKQQQHTSRYLQAPLHALAPLPPLLVFYHPRPATPRELTRRLPRRSPCNAYAGRGVATALLSSRACPTGTEDDDAEDDDLVPDSAFAPPPIPSWNRYGQEDTRDGDSHAQRGQQQAAVHDRREYFLDVGEQRVAAILRRQRQDAVATTTCLDEGENEAEDDTPPSPLSPPTLAPSPAAEDYAPPAEPRHRALLQYALELYRAAQPAAGATTGAVPTDDDAAMDDPCSPLPYTPPPSPLSPHSARNHRPWSEEQTEVEGTDSRTEGSPTPTPREDDGPRRLQQQQLRALADRFGVSLERLAEHRQQQLRQRRG